MSYWTYEIVCGLIKLYNFAPILLLEIFSCIIYVEL